jgi:hypothetical protein
VKWVLEVSALFEAEAVEASEWVLSERAGFA